MHFIPFHVVERRPKKKLTVVRHKWTAGELEEIEKYFERCFAEGRTPRKKNVFDAYTKSKENGGTLHKMYWETTKKKVSNLIAKKKKQVSGISILYINYVVLL